MIKRARIHMHNIQTDPTGTVEKLDYEYEGSIFEKDNRIYLKYEEPVENTGLKSKSLIKMEENILEINRSGPFSSKMIFDKEKATLTEYQTPYGLIPITIKTLLYDKKETDVTLNYILDMGGGYEIKCSMAIDVRVF